MRAGFMNEESDIQWLKDTSLKGVTLPFAWQCFRSFVLQGNEDSPYAVNLYKSIDPNHSDDYYRVRFTDDGTIYAECLEYNGKTDKPYGGFAPIN